MLSKKMNAELASLLLAGERAPQGRRSLRPRQRGNAPRSSDKFINVTLKKTVDWVELKQNRSQVSTHRLAREPVSKK
jgi:hypothetical protein